MKLPEYWKDERPPENETFGSWFCMLALALIAIALTIEHFSPGTLTSAMADLWSKK